MSRQWDGILNQNKAGSAANAEDFTKQFMQDMFVNDTGGAPTNAPSTIGKPFSYTAGGVQKAPGRQQPMNPLNFGNARYPNANPGFQSMDENEGHVTMDPVGQRTTTVTSSTYRPVYQKPQKKVVYNGQPMLATYNSAKDLYSTDNFDTAWNQVQDYVQDKKGKGKGPGGYTNSETMKMVRFMDDTGDSPHWGRRYSTGSVDNSQTGLGTNSTTQSASFKLLQRALDLDEQDGTQSPVVQPPVRSSSKAIKPIIKKPAPSTPHPSQSYPKPQEFSKQQYPNEDWNNRLNGNQAGSASNAADFTKQFTTNTYGGNNQNTLYPESNYPFAHEQPLQSGGRNVPITVEPRNPANKMPSYNAAKPLNAPNQPKMASYNTPASLYSSGNFAEEQSKMRPQIGTPRQPQIKRMAGNYGISHAKQPIPAGRSSFIWPPPESQEHNWRATATPLYIDPSHPVIETR
eukprot:maker-scaffold622_size123092-snap-gene-0.17 protein:Tk01105 transcript:maker-scaffold622_size123092-snap-gene-0.17-mRNA-1 annotation:"phospho-2-dehydro-3-deoxyheptonate aldolase"